MPLKQTTGSRAQVMHGNANKTSGGLTKKQLKYNKQGKIVSKKASTLAKKNNRLVKAGYVTRKGVFGSGKMKGGVDNNNEYFNALNTPESYKLQAKTEALEINNEYFNAFNTPEAYKLQAKTEALEINNEISIPANIAAAIFENILDTPNNTIIGKGSYGTVRKTNTGATKNYKPSKTGRYDYTNKMMSKLLQTEDMKYLSKFFVENNWIEKPPHGTLNMKGTAMSLDKFFLKLRELNIKNKNLIYEIIKIIYDMFYNLFKHKLYYTDLKIENILCILKLTQSNGASTIKICFGDIGSCIPLNYNTNNDYKWMSYWEHSRLNNRQKIMFKWISSYGSINFNGGIIKYNIQDAFESMKIQLDSILFIFIIDLLNFNGGNRVQQLLVKGRIVWLQWLNSKKSVEPDFNIWCLLTGNSVRNQTVICKEINKILTYYNLPELKLSELVNLLVTRTTDDTYLDKLHDSLSTYLQ